MEYVVTEKHGVCIVFSFLCVCIVNLSMVMGVCFNHVTLERKLVARPIAHAPCFPALHIWSSAGAGAVYRCTTRCLRT